MNNTTFGNIFALIEAIAEQTLANFNNFKERMDVLKVNSVQTGKSTGNGTDNDTHPRGKHYCWTHCRSYNKNHNSAKCKNPVDDHVATTTWNNKQGGTKRDATTRTQ